jgi:hypothetical protein
MNPVKSILSRVLITSMFVLSASTLAAKDLTTVPEQNKREDVSTTESDARCFLVSSRAANSGNSEARSLLNIAAVYFWGRLEGRLPSLTKLPDLLSEQNISLTSLNFASELRRCGNLLNESASVMDLTNKEIEKLGSKSK